MVVRQLGRVGEKRRRRRLRSRSIRRMCRLRWSRAVERLGKRRIICRSNKTEVKKEVARGRLIQILHLMMYRGNLLKD